MVRDFSSLPFLAALDRREHFFFLFLTKGYRGSTLACPRADEWSNSDREIFWLVSTQYPDERRRTKNCRKLRQLDHVIFFSRVIASLMSVAETGYLHELGVSNGEDAIY